MHRLEAFTVNLYNSLILLVQLNYISTLWCFKWRISNMRTFKIHFTIQSTWDCVYVINKLQWKASSIYYNIIIFKVFSVHVLYAWEFRIVEWFLIFLLIAVVCTYFDSIINRFQKRLFCLLLSFNFCYFFLCELIIFQLLLQTLTTLLEKINHNAPMNFEHWTNTYILYEYAPDEKLLKNNNKQTFSPDIFSFNRFLWTSKFNW